jgi:hypothetical protein
MSTSLWCNWRRASCPTGINAGGIWTKSRKSSELFHPLVSLSAGLFKVTPGEYASHAEISHRLVDAKKMAKQTSRGSYFIDRRQLVSQNPLDD